MFHSKYIILIPAWCYDLVIMSFESLLRASNLSIRIQAENPDFYLVLFKSVSEFYLSNQKKCIMAMLPLLFRNPVEDKKIKDGHWYKMFYFTSEFTSNVRSSFMGVLLFCNFVYSQFWVSEQICITWQNVSKRTVTLNQVFLSVVLLVFSFFFFILFLGDLGSWGRNSKDSCGH